MRTWLRTWLRKWLGGVTLLLGLIALVVAVLRVLATPSLQPQVERAPAFAFDEDGAIERFARSLEFATVSRQPTEAIASGPGPADGEPSGLQPFIDLHAHLRESFPRVHGALNLEVIHGASLLYTWAPDGPRDAEKRLPILLMGHLDVVPVSPGTEGDWQQDPFGGVVADGFVWGRGSLDDKLSVLAILEAAEALLGDGFAPERTIYFAFGHDEEIGGSDGAARIAERLTELGVTELAMVLDEGGAIVQDMLPGIEAPVAMIGIAEKGSVTLELRVEGPGGHASSPPPQTQIGVLAAAIARLEAKPFPMEISPAVRAMFDWVGPEMSPAERLAFANLWLFEPLVRRSIAATPAGVAMLHTTTAVTMVEGGVKANVLPASASAKVNFRILPGDSMESVEARVRQVIDDPRVEIERSGSGNPPSPVSDARAPAFELLARTVREVEGPEVVVAPYLVMAATDARHFTALSQQVFRFVPARFEVDGMRRVHGTNERVAVTSYLASVRFFRQLMLNSDELP